MRLPHLIKKAEPWTGGLHNDEILPSAGVKRRTMDKKASSLLYKRGGHEIFLLLLKKKGTRANFTILMKLFCHLTYDSMPPPSVELHIIG